MLYLSLSPFILCRRFSRFSYSVHEFSEMAVKYACVCVCACVSSPDLPESEASYAITAGGIADAKE